MHGLGESVGATSGAGGLASDPPATDGIAAPAARLRPGLCFWVAGAVLYGLAAIDFANGHFLEPATRDLWQHIAALRALIADPFDPSNPFVPTEEGSRHFHPYWVAIALFARALGWNEWQAIGFAGFASGAVLLAGIWAFGRTFYRSQWGPLALLAAMVLGWSLPISHTGYHSLQTMVEGIAYPATLLIGLSLLLWAVVIRALDKPSNLVGIVPLTAFMFATHQLGAGIAFITAACFILLWPEGSLRARAAAAAAMAAGLLLAAAWPYHSPFEAIVRTGSPTWAGGLDFYSPTLLFLAGVPALMGLSGMRHPRFARFALPVLASFLIFAALFALGPFGLLIATRFVMPAVLMLHIGLAALLIASLSDWRSIPKRRQLTLFALAVACIQLQAVGTYTQHAIKSGADRNYGSAYDRAQALTWDIADDQPVAAYDVAAWPIVATGQRTLSVPWPEPMIADLGERQAAVNRLFDPALGRQERLSLARRLGVRHLIIDRRGPSRRVMPAGLLQRLEQQSVRRRRAGPFLRFDLE